MQSLRFIRLRGVNILEQLHFEELILRTTKDNCFIFNMGNPTTNIVLGYSGKINELVDVEKSNRDKIVAYRRYTGGGTVVVDRNTVFTTLIANTVDIACKPYPRDIMNWSEGFFKPVFHDLTPRNFKLRENDYVFDDHKFGGNAQTIIKDRWVHHTSFLWDYKPSNMEYLQQPKKRPEYRGDRDHLNFLTKMADHVTSVDAFEDSIRANLEKIFSVTVMKDSGEIQEYKDYLESKKGDFVPRSKIEPL